ncbi:ABC transporter permease [Actinacidiphila sp. bgisy144]|uniref:ABC transporter permease n=1 Tax=Actinacidiphila sp. bgisy144 TaxID=3413791 RepID=UPI003EBC6F7E
MRRYLLTRLAQALAVLWAAYTLSFILLSVLPGDAIRNRINAPDSLMTPQQAQTLLDYYGSNRPLVEQYFRDLYGLFTGDLGYSITNGGKVWSLLTLNLPSTAKLTGLGLVFGLVFAVIVALLINYAKFGWLRDTLSFLPALFTSVPIFVIGIVVLNVFAFDLHVIPPVDDHTFTALIAPAATVGLVVSGPLSQVLSNSVRRTRGQPFVHVMHAKGAGEGYIFRKDVLRNSLLPVLTLLGLTIGELLAGAVVTETVYGRAGLGQLIVTSVNTQDLPVVQGIVLLTTAIYVTVNFATDIVYTVIDPRIALDARTTRVTRARRAATAQEPGTDPAEAAEPSGTRDPVEVARP